MFVIAYALLCALRLSLPKPTTGVIITFLESVQKRAIKIAYPKLAYEEAFEISKLHAVTEQSKRTILQVFHRIL